MYGTGVNGVPVREHRLVSGDVISVGTTAPGSSLPRTLRRSCCSPSCSSFGTPCSERSGSSSSTSLAWCGSRCGVRVPSRRRCPLRLRSLPTRHLSCACRVIDPPQRRGRVFELGDEVTVGRSPGCAVPLDDDTFASSIHARVFRRSGELWIEDLGSTNGTFLTTSAWRFPRGCAVGTV